MAIRPVSAVLNNTGVDIAVWNAFVAANVSVGECGCGATADGEPITVRHGLVFASLRCRGCGAEAGVPPSRARRSPDRTHATPR